MPLVFVLALCPIRSKVVVCEKVIPECHGAIWIHQQALLPHAETCADHLGLCQCHIASVCSDRYEGTLLPTQRYVQPTHHGKQVPRSPAAATASHQTQCLPQLHHLLQCGIRLDTSDQKHIILWKENHMYNYICMHVYVCMCVLPANIVHHRIIRSSVFTFWLMPAASREGAEAIFNQNAHFFFSCNFLCFNYQHLEFQFQQTFSNEWNFWPWFTSIEMFYDAAFMSYSVCHLIHVVASTCRLVCSIVLFNFVPFFCRPPGTFCCKRQQRAGGKRSAGPRGERMLQTPAGL